MCKMTKTVRARCQKRSDMLDGIAHSTKIWEIITADHNGGARSIVLLDPTTNKSADHTKKSLQQFLPLAKRPGINIHQQSSGVYSCLHRFKLESSQIKFSPIWNERNSRKSCPKSQRKNSVSSGAIQPFRRLVERSHGMFLPREIFSKFYPQADGLHVRTDFTHHSTDRSFFFWAEIHHKPHLLQRQQSFSPAWQANVDRHVHGICLAHGRWMDWRHAHRRQGRTWQRRRIRCSREQVEIPRRTNRHLRRKKIIPMCRRIDQTRGTRRTSSFTATLLPPWTSVLRQSTIQANFGGTPNWRASYFNLWDKAGGERLRKRETDTLEFRAWPSCTALSERGKWVFAVKVREVRTDLPK